MIGAITYELRVEATARMEGFAGRLLHASFFKLMDGFNSELAERIHADTSLKPFTVSPLIRPRHEKMKSTMIFSKEPFVVREGDRFFWRVTTWSEEVLAMAATLPVGTPIQIGQVPCIVTKVYSNGQHASGILAPEQILQNAFESARSQEVTLHFLSPVSFRRGTQDYPLPDPQMVFISLAKKWEAADMPARIEPEIIETMSDRLVPSDWSGNTERVYFGRGHGLTGFVGFFNYSLKTLSEEEQQIIKMLAQLAVFTGVGRLAAQGFGQTRISWK